MICNRKKKQASNEREAVSNRIGLILISLCSAGTNSNANTYVYSNSYAHTYPNTNTHSNTDADTHAYSSSHINNYKHAPR
jgi:hypothetical protein